MNIIIKYCLFAGIPITHFTAFTQNKTAAKWKEHQLTFDAKGHTLNNTQCFSPTGEWLIYDTRNEGGMIASTCCIEKVNVFTKEVLPVYKTQTQSIYGPGVGAVSYHPEKEEAVFIQGILNSSKAASYSFTRRTCIKVSTEKSSPPLFMDARDITPPFTPGALRGGTHAYSWSGDGKWISFTYNDFVIEQLQKSGQDVKDLRTVGVMAPIKNVKVEKDAFGENNDGEYFTVVVAKVTDNPKAGSDEIEKAFDEGWIGKAGYINARGKRQKKAIAFQGNVRDKANKIVTEVFVADLPEDITIVNKDEALQGTATSRPNPPAATTQRRITYTTENKHPGIQGPRHWLRSSPDGSIIYFLMKDDKGIVQIFGVPTIGVEIIQYTNNAFPVQSAFSVSPDGKTLAYAADNSIFMTSLTRGKTKRVTKRFSDEEAPEGGMVWSHNGNMIAYNRYVPLNGKRWLQVFVLRH